MRAPKILLLLPMAITACGSDPVQEDLGPAVAPGFQPLPPGPYASAAEVPVPEAAVFQPAPPERHALSNGITVLLLPDRSLPLVELELRLRAGSYSDPAGRTGAAEMTAALLREGGSALWPGDKLDQELAFRGAEIDFSAQPRATVGRFECLSEDLDGTLGMFVDVLLHPSFPEDKLERLRARQLSAIAQRDDDPGQAANREAQRAFYGVDDPRVRRQEAAEVQAITRSELAAFHAERYGSRQALIAVSGDFEPAAMLERLEQALGGWAPQRATPVELPTELTPPPSRRVVLLPRPDVNQAELRLVLEGVRRNHPDYPALQLGSFVFGVGGFGNRMISRIRSELGLAYSTGASWRPGWKQQGLFWGSCGTKNETAALALREMIAVLDGFLERGVPEQEFEQARNRLLNAQVFQVDEPAEVLARVADLEWNGYPWSFHEQAAAAIRDLSAAEVVDACRRHLDTGRLTLFVVGNPEAFDADLAEFGPVEQWDAGAPEPAPGEAEAGPAAADRGAELAGHLLSAHGGQAAWEAVGATGSRIQPEGGPRIEAVLVYPGRFLVRAAEDPAQVYSVLTEGGGWAPGPEGVRRYDADELRQAQLGLKSKLPLVLMRLARSEYLAEAEGERTLLLTDEDGDWVRLELHDHGLCAAITLDDGSRYDFQAYALTGGVMLPARVAWSSGEESAVTSFEWSVNPEVRAEWFEPPAGG